MEAVAAPAPAPVAAPVAAPVVAAAPAAAFVLPVTELVNVAEGSGLQWVHSDSSKVAAAQAALTDEPAPARVPRERPPVAAPDNGPLVLVETRRDLNDVKLPFEQPNA
jgi:ribonuclease E